MALTESQRAELCMLHGICSVPSCNEPIMGWVVGGRKYCADHILEKIEYGARVEVPSEWTRDYKRVVTGGHSQRFGNG